MKTIIIDGIEYNLTPKVLFKKGDFVVIQETTYQITKVENLNVTLSLNGRECLFDIDVLKNARLWNITKDAKEGDVLADGNLPFIFKKIDTNRYSYAYCGISVDDGFKIESDGESGEWTWMQDIKPATKEQRDLLFSKMKEAGYEWDAELKQLKKIEQKPADLRTKAGNWYICDMEVMNENMVTAFHRDEIYYCPKDGYLDVGGALFEVGCLDAFRLATEKEITQPQPKQEWSDEEIENCAREAEDNNCIILAKHIRQLKSLRPQNWTKEDKERYISCLQRLSTGNPEQPETINSKWFKEHVYPQSHWKPSEKQMKWLHDAIESTQYEPRKQALISLYSDLMKLREE